MKSRYKKVKRRGIREMTTEDVQNKEARALMEKFWEAHDKLFEDMDNLTKEQFEKRQHEMWEYRNKASDIEENFFMISLWGLSEKANELYGNK